MTSITDSSNGSPKAKYEYHPNYSYSDADLVLRSSDGIKIRVHTLIMKMSLPIFRDMLEIKHDDSETVEDPIPLEEEENVLEIILDVSYPPAVPHHRNCLPEGMPIELFMKLVNAAQKYDIDLLTRMLQRHLGWTRQPISCPELADGMEKYYPLKIFGLAWNLGWKEIAKALSSRTFYCNLDSMIAQQILREIDFVGAWKLQTLHQRRKIWTLTGLGLLQQVEYVWHPKEERDMCTAYFNNLWTSGNAVRQKWLRPIHVIECKNPHYALVSQCTDWKELILNVNVALNVDVSGSQFLQEEFYQNPLISCLWDAKCCSRSAPDNKRRLKEHFRQVVNHLPSEIEI